MKEGEESPGRGKTGPNVQDKRECDGEFEEWKRLRHIGA